MKGEIWKIQVSEGTFDFIHGNVFTVEELYLPKVRIAFNVNDEKINCFEVKKDDTGRYSRNNSKKVKDVEVPSEVVSLLKDFIAKKKDLDKVKKWYSNI